ncbi:MAG: TIGR00282 family metallophosphoesterase [Deltaproteobacteria bacterium]|nr:TIGR00282 family metallophosphoesterase [Deltaproteobacteria bacterium]
MKILAIGDIFGRPGREVFRDLLPVLIREHRVDFVIANAENAAGGRGLTPKTADEILESPVNVLTAGNHIWEHNTIHPYFDSHPILRPHNVNAALPGKGWGGFAAGNGVRIGVISLQGVVYMSEKGHLAENPFHSIDKLLPEIKRQSDVVLIDFHAEATSEKRALGWYLDGKVTALLGTHTHVQTADEEVLPKGTAYISDLGMTGPHGSVIGLDKEVAIHRFLTGEKRKFKVAEEGVTIDGVLIDVNEKTGLSKSIKRISEKI